MRAQSDASGIDTFATGVPDGKTIHHPSRASMRLSRRLYCTIAWIALCAVLMVSIAPGISRVLAAATGLKAGPATGLNASQHMGPECHMSDTGGAPHKAALSIDACGYCTMQGDLPALLPLPLRTDLALQLLRFAPPLFFVAPRPLFAWLAPRSRAPPQR